MIDLVTYYGSRAVCRLFGHRWAPTGLRGMERCSRKACRGRDGARRRVS